MENTEYDWKDMYNKQRKERLTDAIHDYLDDSETSIEEFYRDLQDIITEMLIYHKSFGEKAASALLLIHGKSEQKKEETSQFLTEEGKNLYSYQADITLEKIKEFQRGTSL